MDIQISSNFERYLFELLGRDSAALTALMDEFKDTGRFSISDEFLTKAREDFSAHRCSDDDTLAVIKDTYDATGEVLDPHSAIALSGALSVQGDVPAPIVSLACAHAAKFPDAVEKAIGMRPALPERLGDLFEREEFLTPMDNDLAAVQEFVRERSRV